MPEYLTEYPRYPRLNYFSIGGFSHHLPLETVNVALSKYYMVISVMCVLQQENIIAISIVRYSLQCKVVKPTRSSTFVGAFLSRRAHTYTAAAGCGGHSMRPSDPWHFDWDPQFLQSEQGIKVLIWRER